EAFDQDRSDRNDAEQREDIGRRHMAVPCGTGRGEASKLPAGERGGRSDGRGGTFPNSIGHRTEKRHRMADIVHHRAHVVAGGFPPGSSAGHDHDYARLRLLTLLADRQVPASVANDFVDVEKWLPVSRLLVTYVA